MAKIINLVKKISESTEHMPKTEWQMSILSLLGKKTASLMLFSEEKYQYTMSIFKMYSGFTF